MVSFKFEFLALFLVASTTSILAADSVFYSSSGYSSGGLGVHPSQFLPTLPQSIANEAPALNILTPAPPANSASPNSQSGALSTASQSDFSKTFDAPILLSLTGGDVTKGGPVMIEQGGGLVWTAQDQGFNHCFNFQVQSYKGDQVLTFWNGTFLLPGYGKGTNYIYSASYELIGAVAAANQSANESDIHEFRITPQDTALVQSWRPAQVDLTPVNGSPNGWTFDCVFQEVEIETNKLLFEWRSLEHIPVNETYFALSGQDGVQDNPFDYCHINSIDQNSVGDFLISMRGTSSIYKISRQTGEILWRLGGKISDFQMGNGTAFFFQHDARWHNNGSEITLFDNGTGGNGNNEATARGVVLAVDENARTATLKLAMAPSWGNTSASQGNVQLLPNGNYFVGWGATPWVSEYDPQGNLVYDATFAARNAPPDSVSSYRAFKSLWTASPSTLPSLFYNTSASTLFASWNGATNVSQWQLLTGNNSDGTGMKEFGGRSDKGSSFEVGVPLDKAPDGQGFVAVAALDQNGACLGASGIFSFDNTPSNSNASCAMTSMTGNNTGGEQSPSNTGPGSNGSSSFAGPRMVFSGFIGAVLTMFGAVWVLV